jgi:hypothetical protein
LSSRASSTEHSSGIPLFDPRRLRAINRPHELQNEETFGSLFSGNCDKCSFQFCENVPCLLSLFGHKIEEMVEEWTKFANMEINNFNFQ